MVKSSEASDMSTWTLMQGASCNAVSHKCLTGQGDGRGEHTCHEIVARGDNSTQEVVTSHWEFNTANSGNSPWMMSGFLVTVAALWLMLFRLRKPVVDAEGS